MGIRKELPSDEQFPPDDETRLDELFEQIRTPETNYTIDPGHIEYHGPRKKVRQGEHKRERRRKQDNKNSG